MFVITWHYRHAHSPCTLSTMGGMHPWCSTMGNSLALHGNYWPVSQSTRGKWPYCGLVSHSVGRGQGSASRRAMRCRPSLWGVARCLRPVSPVHVRELARTLKPRWRPKRYALRYLSCHMERRGNSRAILGRSACYLGIKCPKMGHLGRNKVAKVLTRRIAPGFQAENRVSTHETVLSGSQRDRTPSTAC